MTQPKSGSKNVVWMEEMIDDAARETLLDRAAQVEIRPSLYPELIDQEGRPAQEAVLPEEVDQCYRQQLAIEREAGDRKAMAEILLSLGTLQIRQGHGEQALPDLEAAQQLARQLADQQLSKRIQSRMAEVQGAARSAAQADGENGTNHTATS